MDWASLGGRLAQAGAPIIGTALGGPLGGLVGGALGTVVAEALGTAPTPEAVGRAIATTPAPDMQAKLSAAESEAMARWPALAEIARVEAELQARALAETTATMRAEATAGDPLQRWWRPAYAFELTIECAAFFGVLIWSLGRGDAGPLNAATHATGLLGLYWGARFAVLGVYVNGRTREKEAATTGQPAPSLVETVVRTVKGRR
ncbi:3TM-type holin [Rhodoplanes sp. SY1]|uniref:3TM-type holin n=1 Tax=Rhodoplanes sp. SY1 TaxID=3166646 RepID=UPI0038B52591